jgi:hypothetical protein
MVFKLNLTILLSFTALLHSSPIENITQGIKNNNKLIQNAKVHFTYSTTTHKIAGTEEEIKQQAQKKINDGMSAIDTAKLLTLKDRQRFDDIKLKQIKSYIKTLTYGYKETDQYELYFDSKSAKLSPSKLSLEKNSRPIEYYSKAQAYVIYYPAASEIIISNRSNVDATSLGTMLEILRDVPLCRSDMFSDLSRNSKIIETKNTINILQKNGAYDCEFQFQNNDSYNLINYSSACVFDKSLVKYSIADYASFGNIQYPQKINIDAFIDNVLVHTTEIIVHSVVVNAIFQDDEFMPTNLPFANVQDDRFKPTLHYPVKGKLLSDEQLLEFAADEKKLQKYIALFRKLN